MQSGLGFKCWVSVEGFGIWLHCHGRPLQLQEHSCTPVYGIAAVVGKAHVSAAQGQMAARRASAARMVLVLQATSPAALAHVHRHSIGCVQVLGCAHHVGQLLLPLAAMPLV